MASIHPLVAPASTLGCRLRRFRFKFPICSLLLLLGALLALRLSLFKLQRGLVACLKSVNDQQPAISRA